MALSAYKKHEFFGWFFEISRLGSFEWVCSAGHKNATSGNEARNAEAKRDRDEQREGQAERGQEEEPDAKRPKDEPQLEDDDMGCRDEPEKDINQMEFWEVYNAEADNCIAHGEEQPEDTTFWDDNSGRHLASLVLLFL